MLKGKLGNSSKYEINATSGPLFKQILQFVIPLIISSNLQLLYNAVDVIVIGQFEGEEALAAVGSTGALTHLIVTIFLGLSIGTSVIMSKYYGQNDPEGMYRTTHTSIAVSFLGGAIVTIVGVFASKPLLQLMGSPENVIGLSTTYMQIIFLGMIPNLVYNFGSALMRALGDTRRPLYFLMISGVVNVVLNLLFVIVFKLGVAGVALGTIISQTCSMTLVLIALKGNSNYWSLRFKELKIYKDELIQIAKIGIPAGIQGMMFSIANVMIQSSINSFQSAVMAGTAASNSIESFIYVSMNSFHQAAVTFTSQNMGVKNYDRVKKVLKYCLLLVIAVCAIMGSIAMIFGKELISLYNDDPQVVEYGLIKLSIIASTYFMCGIMDVFAGQLRGMGYGFSTMIIVVCGVCVARIIWIYTVFAHFNTLEVLFYSYPITWTLTAFAYLIFYLIVIRKYKNQPIQPL